MFSINKEKAENPQHGTKLDLETLGFGHICYTYKLTN